MKYIVLDLEWNQAPSSSYIDKLPMPLAGEIIQIGAVKLSSADEGCVVEDELRLNVRPQYYTRLHSGVRRLTGLTSATLKDGLPFAEAAEKLRLWCGDEFRLFIWGFDDIAVLGENLALHGLDSSWVPPCYNLQYIYCAETGCEKRQWTLTTVVEALGIVLDVPAHDALNDALYTAAVLRRLDIEKGIREYDPKDLITQGDIFTVMSHRVLVGYETKQQAQASKRVTVLHCPICHARLKYEGFYRQNKSKRIAEGNCPEHGDFLCRLQFIHCENGRFRVMKTIYKGTPETHALYEEKRNAALEAEARFTHRRAGVKRK